MILIIPQIFLPILAGFGLMEIIRLKNENASFNAKLVKYFAFGAAGLFVVFVLLSGVISDWFIQRVNESPKGEQLRQAADLMAGMFVKDLLLAFAFVSAVFLLSFAYLKNKISADFLTAIVILLTVIDLFRISSRGIQYSQAQDTSGGFATPEYIRTIDNQKNDQPYRLLNLKQDGSLGSYGLNSNYNMYFLKQDLAGYSGIKPRTYEDYVRVVSPANPTLWRMLNVKYIILERAIQFPGLVDLSPGGNDHVYLNTGVLPRAYFVNKCEVKTPIEILNKVKNNEFDPKDIAFTEKELKIDKPDTLTYAKVTEYGYDTVKIEALASGNNLLFLGDTYYPHGWKATIDGNETEIYRVNYGFRGIIVPKGKHAIEFVYAPKSYAIGKAVSLSINLLLLLGLVASIFIYVKDKKTKQLNPTA